MLVTLAGCAAPGGPKAPQGGAAADLFAPPPLPADFDRERAEMPLATIPGNPPAPAKAEAVAEPELPRQALRRLEEARRLFAEQRYTETLAELEKALGYNATHPEAHRLSALACLLSGNDRRAKAFAERALELKPDDLACHYVTARLAEKADDADVALKSYRLALKCPVAEADRSYRTLTHYHLGLMLERLGYYRAAVEQLDTFEAEARALGDREPANPELATILRVNRGSAAVRLARAHEMLRQFGPAADALAVAVAYSPQSVELQAPYIAALVRADRLDAAARQASEYVATTRGDVRAVEMLLAVHQVAGHPERGLDTVRDIVAGQQDNVDLWIVYVDALLAAQRLDEAVQTLNDLLARHPQASDARWKLVAIHRFRAEWPQWLAALSGELAVRPTEAARAETELGQMPAEAAARAVDEAVGRAEPPRFMPASLPSREQEAALAYCAGKLADRLGRTDDANRLFERAMEHQGGFAPAAIGAAEMFIRRCEWDRAIRVIESVSDSADDAWTGTFARLSGQCADGLDRTEEAIRHFEEAIKHEPSDTRAMMLLGQILDRLNRRDDAQRQYERIIAGKPKHLEAREALIRNLWSRWNVPSKLKQLVSELSDLERIAPQETVTVRCKALVRFLTQPPDMDAYKKVLQALIESDPDDLESRRALTAVAYQQREYDTCRTHLTALLDREPCDRQANEILAMTLMMALDIDAAADQLSRCLAWYPNSESLLLHLADVRLVQQDFDAAIALWEKLLAREATGDRRTAYQVRLVTTLWQARRFERARELAEKWMGEADREQVSGFRQLVLAADAGLGDHERYFERCRAWLEAQPDQEDVRQWLLGLDVVLPPRAKAGLIGTGRLDEAVAQAMAWLAEKPDSDAANERLVSVLQAAGRHDDAIEIIRSSLAAASGVDTRVGYLQKLAEAYLLAERYDEAIARANDLRVEVEKLSQEVDLFRLGRFVGSVLTRARRYDDAISHYKKMLVDVDESDQRLEAALKQADNPGLKARLFLQREILRGQKAELLRYLSFAHQSEERPDLAEERMREAHELAPEDPGINNDLGYTLAEAGKDIDEAERMTRLAVSEVLWDGVGVDPLGRQPPYIDSLGWVFYKRGRFEQARFWLSLAASMPEGQDAVIYDHLGDTYWRLGRREEAIEHWARSLELHAEQAAKGEAQADDKLVPAVQAKLSAARGGGEPKVAATVQKLDQ